jgi:hypothetical protein
LLLREARQDGLEGNYEAGVVYQYWGVVKTGAEQYDLACHMARLGKSDAAFYWLQEAGLKDGIYPEWADEDPDLQSLRSDPRWRTIRPYFDQCRKYWQTNGKPVTVLIEPKQYAKGPGPLFVWLHGTYSPPDPRYAEQSVPIPIAVERFGRPLAGVSGPVIFGPAKFNWSEKPEQDFRRVMEALKELPGRLKSPAKSIIAIGLSQGGQVAVEIAARHPEQFAGAIAVAPGAQEERYLERLPASPLLKKRGFVIVTGNLDKSARYVAAIDAMRLKRAGVNVLSKNSQTSGTPCRQTLPSAWPSGSASLSNRRPIRRVND